MAPVDGSPQAPSTAKMAYEALAPAYDDFTHFHDYDLWIANLWPRIAARGIHGKRLLDVACGTGKSFIPLLERGWEVTACDISPAMIEVARAKVGGRATLAVADMRALPRFGEFDLVWCLDDALNYLLDPGDLVRALTGMRANLAPRGLLVFDLNAIGSYRGFFAELQMGSAWGLALAFPFILTYAILRGAIDGTLRRNVFVNTTANYIGGGVCGTLAGVIVSGIAVMSTGMLRLPYDMGLFDYAAVQISASGSVQKGNALWVPTDRLTSWFYDHLSQNVFHSETALASYYPAFYATAGASRYTATAGDGRARNTVRPGAVSLAFAYTLEPTVTGKARLDEMTKDIWSAPQPSLTDFNGEPIAATAKLYGYVISFGTPAREKNGQVLVGNAQICLLAEDAEGTASLVFPNAILAKAQPPNIDPNDAKARRKEVIEFSRFPFASGGAGKFFPSVGADSDVKFGFEFLVPQGMTPKALYVKGLRLELNAVAPEDVAKYTTAAARDQDLPRIMTGGGKVGPLSEDNPPVFVKKKGAGGDTTLDSPPDDFGFQMSIQIGVTLQRDQLQGGSLVSGRGGYAIQEGEYRLRPADVQSGAGLEAALKVDKYEPVENQVVCQLDVGMDKEWRFGERGFDNDKPLFLVDDKGRSYKAIGFFYRDADNVAVRYTPGSPLKGLTDLPKALSRSEPGQQCKLIFRVSKGVTITGFAIGDKLAIKWQPKFKVNADQMPR